ncbi:MAG: hypothetical protein Q4C87_02430 [Actinomycetaceae bacterium]|nr:hypothetical protein [Actinomycetaceae bacterium]
MPKLLPTHRRIDSRFLPAIGSVVTLIVILGVGEMRYGIGNGARPFISMKLFSNLLIDNSYLLVLAVGMTFVILTGGIDLSVGAVVALVGLITAKAFMAGLPLPLVLLLGVLVGTACGTAIGILVQVFDIQPFIASLAVMFLARGLANVVSVESLPIKNDDFAALAAWSLKFDEGKALWRVNASMIVAALIVLIGFIVLHYTRFGRSVYGLGAGDRGQAVQLMGLNDAGTRFGVYVISGTCAGVAGILFALYTKSGFNLTGVGMELDAIAAVVIGGTLLAGGYGFVLGSGVGVVIYGLIQVLIAREGLDSWWTKVFIGVVLLAFVFLQRVIVRRRE